MVYVEYCDKCGREVAGWDNEYGQVMTVKLNIISDSDNNHNNGVMDGKSVFCSAKCAMEYLQSCVNIERKWIETWKRGKILGVAPIMPLKKERKD